MLSSLKLLTEQRISQTQEIVGHYLYRIIENLLKIESREGVDEKCSLKVSRRFLLARDKVGGP
jgi:hypothetical protein